ncbi:hypothetical protein L218DRAFT_830555, partial [Marasmius fiardii PR-910]
KLQSSMLKIMLSLPKKSALCPYSLMIRDVQKLGDFPVAQGDSGDIWKGRIGGQTICLKTIKVYQASDASKSLKALMQEAIVWQQLEHPNLLPFVGMSLDEAQKQLCLISLWMEGGNLLAFVQKAPR